MTITSKENRDNAIFCLIGIVVGAVLGNLISRPINGFVSTLNNVYCNADSHIRTGKDRRKKALELEVPKDGSRRLQDAATKSTIISLHRSANDEFKKAADCGNAMAEAYLGQAFCFGWGVDKNLENFQKGRNMIVEASRRENLTEWLLDPTYCHD